MTNEKAEGREGGGPKRREEVMGSKAGGGMGLRRGVERGGKGIVEKGGRKGRRRAEKAE